ncbi:MAG: M15 family metallopeptidase [Firmicutes bacterium]|nr:M15 family metallopeptidase [Bacillota bacterium]
MSKKKYKINLKRFIPFILVIALIVTAAVWAAAKDKKPNPKRCKHNFENGVCTICGGFAKDYCKHEYEAGVCKICGMQCEHEYMDGVCKTCGMEEDPKLKWPNTTTSFDSYPLSSATDDMLVLVNKKYHVTQSYEPDDLVVVQRWVQGVGDPSQGTNAMRREAAQALNTMLDAAAAQGYDMKLRTGYRSYSYQEMLFNSYARNYGESEANKYSARAGQSEHHTGLACDLGAASQGYELRDDFGESPEGKWIKDHCCEYGFILRYIDGTLDSVGQHTGYIYEAWHIRYVGVDAAKIITDNGWTFEEYLEAVASVRQ